MVLPVLPAAKASLRQWQIEDRQTRRERGKGKREMGREKSRDREKRREKRSEGFKQNV
jgi:hypothetical protein